MFSLCMSIKKLIKLGNKSVQSFFLIYRMVNFDFHIHVILLIQNIPYGEKIIGQVIIKILMTGLNVTFFSL